MTSSKPVKHQWVVDGIEEGMARVEQDGGVMLTIPLWVFPSEVREGQVLSVTRAAAAGSSTVTISIDDDATSAALEQSKASVAKVAAASRKKDPGGDVKL
jgi:hypothetical protein